RRKAHAPFPGALRRGNLEAAPRRPCYRSLDSACFCSSSLVNQRPQPLQPKPGDGLVLLNLLEPLLNLLFGEPPPAQQLAAGDDAQVTFALLHPDPLLLVLGQDALEDDPVGELLQRCVRPPNRPQCQDRKSTRLNSS